MNYAHSYRKGRCSWNPPHRPAKQEIERAAPLSKASRGPSFSKQKYHMATQPSSSFLMISLVGSLIAVPAVGLCYQVYQPGLIWVTLSRQLACYSQGGGSKSCHVSELVQGRKYPRFVQGGAFQVAYDPEIARGCSSSENFVPEILQGHSSFEGRTRSCSLEAVAH